MQAVREVALLVGDEFIQTGFAVRVGAFGDDEFANKPNLAGCVSI